MGLGRAVCGVGVAVKETKKKQKNIKHVTISVEVLIAGYFIISHFFIDVKLPPVCMRSPRLQNKSNNAGGSYNAEVALRLTHSVKKSDKLPSKALIFQLNTFTDHQRFQSAHTEK